MDPVTHTLVGVAMANAFFRTRAGPRAVPVLAAASNLPDIDGAVHLSFDPAAVVLRRTFGHSIFLLPLWSALFAWAVKRYWFRDMKWRTVFGLTLLGCAVHLFFDLINSFGVVLLWPFSDWRPELSIVFIIDLALTFLLAAPLLLSWPKRHRHRLPGLSRMSLALVGAYLLLCGTGRSLALFDLAGTLRQTGMRPQFLYAFPEPLGPHRWRGVLRAGDIYRVFLINSLTGTVEPRGEVETFPDDPRVLRARETSLGRRLDAFFKAPVWTVRDLQPTGAAEVDASDLRFSSLVLDRNMPFRFRFLVPAQGEVRRL